MTDGWPCWTCLEWRLLLVKGDWRCPACYLAAGSPTLPIDRKAQERTKAAR